MTTTTHTSDTSTNYRNVIVTAIAAYANGIMAVAFDTAGLKHNFGTSTGPELLELANFLGHDVVGSLEKQLVDGLAEQLAADAAAAVQTTLTMTIDELAARRHTAGTDE